MECRGGAARWVAVAVLGCLCALPVAVPSAAASASSGSRASRVKHRPHTAPSPPPLTPGSTYLALGDSVPFGYQDPGTGQNPAQIGTVTGYPEVFGQLRHVNVVNASCPGETSASMIQASAISGGCTNWGGTGTGYRALYPLHVAYTGSQLAYAVSYLQSHHNVRLVSLTIGAVDFEVCRNGSADSCTAPGELAPLETTLRTNVRSVLEAIRGSAHYTGQLAIVDYYATDYTGSPADHAILSINAALDGAAAPFGVELVHGYPAFAPSAANGHRTPCQAGLLDALPSGICGYHPSLAGQTVLARALAQAVH